MQQLQVLHGFASLRGPRPRNEDYAGIYTGTAIERSRWGIVAAVADGVGGNKGGRVAAESAVRSFIDGYYSQSETVGVQRAAARAVEGVNRWLYTIGRTDPMLEHAAATLSAVVLRGRKGHVLHAGDSRVYRLRADRLERLTEDHCLGGPNLSHVLYRAVGIEPGIRLDYSVSALEVHDRYLLVTDGVHGVLNDKQIRALLMRRSAPQEDAEALVNAALMAGSQDNTTALIIDVMDIPPPDQDELSHALAKLPAKPVPRVGETLDGFHITAELSRGRYSCLVIATDTLDGKTVILKFPQAATPADAVMHRAFAREAWVAGSVRSPYLGTVLSQPPDRQTCLYAVMPYYAGETLDARLRRFPPLSLSEGTTIALRLIKAVTALHRSGIIHRDIKPENIILEPGGGLKLIDFGVVRLPQADDASCDAIPGTPSYMAPELFAGAPGDERSDVFALGVTLYRAFSGGAYPYGEIEPFMRPRFGAPAPLAQHRPDLPAWLDHILRAAIAVDPRDRPGDAVELGLAIEDGLSGGAQRPTRPKPLYELHPVRFWQCISLMLFIALVTAMAQLSWR